MASTCQALYLSDERRCQEPTTNANGLFCKLHARQCYGLYRGYKARNAKLDTLNAGPPSYLATSPTALANHEFSDVKEEIVLREVHAYLIRKYALLERVIRARKLHHSRFYAMSMDYGHQKYLDKLQSDRDIVLRALERLERRTAAVLYEKQKWYGWVRALEDEEDQKREKESKRVKREAIMFKRHWAVVEARIQKRKRDEQRKMQDDFLDKAYHERMAQRETEQTARELDSEDDLEWDPIDDYVEDNRYNYLDLIRTFLWEQLSPNCQGDTISKDATALTVEDKPSTAPDVNDNKENGAPSHRASPNDSPSSKPSRDAKKKKKTKKTRAQNDTDQESPGHVPIETVEDMMKRLKEGTKYQHGAARIIGGTLESPMVTNNTAPLPDEEIDTLVRDIRDIKLLLFCRVLLKHATVLPAAVRANSVEEFLNDTAVPSAELRDICLHMEQPELQDLRDACADLNRQDDDDDIEEQSIKEEPRPKKEYSCHPFEKMKLEHGLPEKFELTREKALKDAMTPNDLRESDGIDFGTIDDQSQHDIKKIKVRVCGRQIFYYPSDKAMARDGWLQFSIISKDSSMFDAISLCKSWEEFFHINILALFQYFPNGSWVDWIGPDRYRQQLLQLGFIGYFTGSEAEKMTKYHQSGSRAHGRSHAAIELRSFICAHIKRNDPASRRLIQYLRMDTSQVCVLVRDAATGKIICAPPKEELWLCRDKLGLGRAAKNHWRTVKAVGPQFFEEMDQYRQWHFGFRDYYDIYVWERDPGRHISSLQRIIQDTLLKAQRFRTIKDMYKVAAPVLSTLHKEVETCRIRDTKLGEQSIWDNVQNEHASFSWSNAVNGERTDGPLPRRMVYSKSDELEDAELFPAEDVAEDIETNIPLNNARHAKWNIDNFIQGYSYEEDSDIEEHLQGARMPDEDGEDEDGSESSSDEDAQGEWTEESQDSTDDVITDDRLFACQGLSRKEQRAYRSFFDGMMGNPYQDSSNEALEWEFPIFLDAQKASIFKQAWHACDMEPDAQWRWVTMQKSLKRLRKGIFETCTPADRLRRREDNVRLLRQLGNVSEWTRTTSRDMEIAYTIAAVFFLNNAQMGVQFDDPFNVTDQHERSKQLPDVRSHHSNKTRNQAFWKAWDEQLDQQRDENGHLRCSEDFWTEEDRCAIRPIIARFYKHGIIGCMYSSASAGLAMAGRETRPKALTSPGPTDTAASDQKTHAPLDLYFDWRRGMDGNITVAPGMSDPDTLEPLKLTARRFATTHPHARFSLLRIWSAPHFYPFMIGYNKRDSFSFSDPCGRTFEWKFLPKDSILSEWSCHFNLSARFQPYRAFFRGGSAEVEGGFPGKPRRGEVDRAVVRRDKILVMGADEAECLKYTAAAVFCVQTRPWRLEVDVLKSFGNVDVKFVKELDDFWVG